MILGTHQEGRRDCIFNYSVSSPSYQLFVTEAICTVQCCGKRAGEYYLQLLFVCVAVRIICHASWIPLSFPVQLSLHHLHANKKKPPPLHQFAVSSSTCRAFYLIEMYVATL
ncbi:hypothetical protein Nepgr_005785 [Nepenthes gracilis]|uniref:Uncharacterized protein n=1 Tax=Nepenthes gracilis TaxID=150966 RepID=A0AAD3XGX6_NEPGR|nr:hypothetical protein Nepgr_005785 [Nepenthes gracilis]